ncbi:unnamed protein product, partial [Ectocarpus sp. 12 AP-2014]
GAFYWPVLNSPLPFRWKKCGMSAYRTCIGELFRGALVSCVCVRKTGSTFSAAENSLRIPLAWP